MSEPDAQVDGEPVANTQTSATRRRRHPFQRLAYIRPEAEDQYGSFLIAHCLILLVVDSKSGAIVATWDAESTGSKGAISLLNVNHQGNHVALVTSEDKAVHILSISQERVLSPLNKRILPKRPSCLCWTPDDRHVLAGDKFGDVYDLPLQIPAPEIPSAPQEPPAASNEPESNQPTDAPAIITGDEVQDSKIRGFKPSASELTVHSGRNRRALENQQRTAAGKHDQKKEIDASLKVVLGHVSMLTALLCRRVPTSRAIEGADTFWQSPEQNEAWKKEIQAGRFRDYIITSDRDEHIRVSRGLPQAHIIENYCLSHTSFVSALCIPEEFETSNLLFSGGGDNWVGCWNWLRGELICKIPLLIPGDSDGKIAVSGMWSCRPADGNGVCIVVAIEATPSYFLIKSSNQAPKSELDFQVTFHEVNGIILDAVSVASTEMLLAYDDGSSRPVQGEEGDDDITEEQENPRLHVLPVNDSTSSFLASEPEPVKVAVDIDKTMSEEMKKQKLEHDMQESDNVLINDLFCSVERMRKRGGFGDEGNAGED